MRAHITGLLRYLNRLFFFCVVFAEFNVTEGVLFNVTVGSQVFFSNDLLDLSKLSSSLNATVRAITSPKSLSWTH